jgi:Plasmid pRiA4b ORF-3-like protein
MSSNPIARIRVSLKHIEPEIWRVVEVPIGMDLKSLHDVIQAAMGWRDYHLFEFRIGKARYGSPEVLQDRKVLRAELVKLAGLMSKGVDRFDYIYDFGDNWEHVITIEAVAEADSALKYPCFVAGARRGPPEDVGGPPGFFDFLAAVTNPYHPEHRRLVDWHSGLDEASRRS